MRMSIRTTSGRWASTAARDLRAVLGLADDLEVRRRRRASSTGRRARARRRRRSARGSGALMPATAAMPRGGSRRRGVAVLEAPAGEADALREADQPRAGARDLGAARTARAARRLTISTVSPLPGAPSIVASTAAPRRVLARVRQPLLHDPVDGAAGGGGHGRRRRRAARTRSRCRRRADSSTRSATSRERRLRALALAARRLGARSTSMTCAQVLERLVGARADDARRRARSPPAARRGGPPARPRAGSAATGGAPARRASRARSACAPARAPGRRAGRARPRPGGCARAARA